MQEVMAQGAQVVFLSDETGVVRLGDLAAATIELPTVDPFVVAVLKGTDLDQPRNPAKSVTVE